MVKAGEMGACDSKTPTAIGFSWRNNMPSNKLADKFNTRALNIWRQYGAGQQRVPSLYRNIKHDARLVIVGMNPSFNANWVQGRMATLNAAEATPMSAEELFSWDESAADKIALILELEAQAQNTYGIYFKPIERFSVEVGCSDQWQHLDLFLLRETSQTLALRAVLLKTTPTEVLNDFGQAQIDLFIELMHDIGPEAVLIANATASGLACRLLGLRRVPNEPAAFELESLPRTRFFLSGMLSGQRAMDNYAKERLGAQIRKYLIPPIGATGPKLGTAPKPAER
jgi:hypothetical protein